MLNLNILSTPHFIIIFTFIISIFMLTGDSSFHFISIQFKSILVNLKVFVETN